jgi:hypothetical protein
MRKSIILILMLCILPIYTYSLLAQSRRMDMADYEKRKMEYIKKEAGLTKEEADKYFPLNSELTQKKFELYKQHRDKIQRIKENNNISDQEYRKLLEDDLEIKVKEAALDKLYAPQFEKILGPEKLFRAQQAERKFIQQEVTNFRNEQENRSNQGTNRGNSRRR